MLNHIGGFFKVEFFCVKFIFNSVYVDSVFLILIRKHVCRIQSLTFLECFINGAACLVRLLLSESLVIRFG